MSLPLKANLLYAEPVKVEITTAVSAVIHISGTPSVHQHTEKRGLWSFFPTAVRPCKQIPALTSQRRLAGRGYYPHLADGFLRPERHREWQSQYRNPGHLSPSGGCYHSPDQDVSESMLCSEGR